MKGWCRCSVRASGKAIENKDDFTETVAQQDVIVIKRVSHSNFNIPTGWSTRILRWSDSTTVLFWLKKGVAELENYIVNRMAKIRNINQNI